MVNKLDDISVEIGEIRSSLKTLFNRAQEDRQQQQRNHDANQQAIGDLRDGTQKAISELAQTATHRWEETTDALRNLTTKLQEHADAVSNMKPEIRDLKISRGRLAALASVGLLALWVIGRALEAGISSVTSWGMDRIFHK